MVATVNAVGRRIFNLVGASSWNWPGSSGAAPGNQEPEANLESNVGLYVVIAMIFVGGLVCGFTIGYLVAYTRSLRKPVLAQKVDVGVQIQIVQEPAAFEEPAADPPPVAFAPRNRMPTTIVVTKTGLTRSDIFHLDLCANVRAGAALQLRACRVCFERIGD